MKKEKLELEDITISGLNKDGFLMVTTWTPCEQMYIHKDDISALIEFLQNQLKQTKL